MKIKCDYCKRINDEQDMCSGCGAPLPGLGPVQQYIYSTMPIQIVSTWAFEKFHFIDENISPQVTRASV